MWTPTSFFQGFSAGSLQAQGPARGWAYDWAGGGKCQGRLLPGFASRNTPQCPGWEEMLEIEQKKLTAPKLGKMMAKSEPSPA